MRLVKELSTAAIAILVLTVMLGVAYPLVMTGISQVVFPGKADGSQVTVDGKVVGSRLIARPFTLRGGQPDPSYFQPRKRAPVRRGGRRKVDGNSGEGHLGFEAGCEGSRSPGRRRPRDRGPER